MPSDTLLRIEELENLRSADIEIMPSRKSISIVVAGLLLLIAGVYAYSHIAAQHLDGVWVRKTAVQYAPDQLKVRVENGEFQVTFSEPYRGKFESVTLKLDGLEHAWAKSNDPLGSWNGPMTYSATLNGSAVDVSTHYAAYSNLPEHVNVEHWSLTGGGRRMVVTNGALVFPSVENEITYERVPLVRTLFTNAP